jgi:hypothetical protein
MVSKDRFENPVNGVERVLLGLLAQPRAEAVLVRIFCSDQYFFVRGIKHAMMNS